MRWNEQAARWVEVVFARPGEVRRVELPFREGMRVREALLESGLLELLEGGEACAVGIFGERVPLDRPLRPFDRVELYRPLRCDPLTARRLRVRDVRRASHRP